MLFKKSRSEKAADKASDLLGTVKDKLDDSPTLAQVKESVAEKAGDWKQSLEHQLDQVDTDQLKSDASDAAGEAKKQADKAAKQAKKAAKDARKKVRRSDVGKKVSHQVAAVADSDQVAAARERAIEAGLTREQAHELFTDEWMPRIQHALSTAAAGTAAAVSKLPEPAQDQVAKVAPELVKRKKKGRLLIFVGVATLAGAGYLYYQGQQKKQAAAARPAQPTPPTHALSEDPAGSTQARVEQAVAGDAPSAFGKHAARE